MDLVNVIFIVLFFASFGFFLFNCKRLISYIRIGQKENRCDNINERIKNVLVVAFGQSKLFREPFAGLLHFLIFWGFILFSVAVLESFLQGFYTPFSFEFLGVFHSVITFVQDVFGLLVISAVIFSFYRRFVLKIKRLLVDKHGNYDAGLIFVLILLVVIAMFGQNISSIAKRNFILSEYEVRPLSFYLSQMIYSSSANANIFYEIFWWLHVVFIFTFLNYLPYSKHLHILSSIPNVFFAELKSKRNQLKPLNLEDEKIEWFGVDDVQKFSWKQILDGYSCTECGRCTSACPASNSGKSLSPRKIIVDIRKRTTDVAPLIIEKKFENDIVNKTLVHNYISDKELWQCTTCMACLQECPVMIEHISSIVDMRRHLVLTESNFPATINPVFKNLETNFTPWAFNKADRAEWAEGMNIKTMAEDSKCEILFWVGCAGSFDNRYKKVTKAFATLMQKADIDFRILGTEEKCNGDTARRLGNEYLAQQLIKENIETLNNYNVKKIVTACPHCFNSIKNEYRQFDGNYEVIHHSQMISDLISQGKITLKNNEISERVTFHDSCYLGRYNGVYDSPRQSLNKINGLELVEMERNKSKGFCCGAGGGRMFLEDEEGGRINEERTKEAIKVNPDTIASACPFCLTMMTDGIKANNKIDSIKAKDIAEIVLENSN